MTSAPDAEVSTAEWMRRIGDDPRITGTTLAVGLVFATFGGEPGKPVWPSHGRIGAATGLSRETVSRHTRKLVDLGYLSALPAAGRADTAARWPEVTQRDARTKVYRLTVPAALREHVTPRSH
jgi:DNA-binding transcriptional ArsR family regulator